MKKLILILFLSFSSMFAFEELNSNNFEEKIGKGNVIVDFHAIWWSSCKILGENLHKYDKTTKATDVKIFKLDVPKEKEISKKYKVRGVPALIYFKDGKALKTYYGIQSPEKLKMLEIKHFK